jgi:aspartyl-tRNA(Asn)/glutamyl-tRNA(Gln) amidotransferase subunit A
MNAEDLCFLPATELAVEISSRNVSPVEVITTVIERIERLEPKINAFSAFTPDRALEDARAAEEAIQRGDALGPLHGVPVTIKDLADVAGLPSERGSWTMRGNVASTDSPFVSRLRAAGAIILGKTTTSEHGWKGVSQSPLTGITSNPWRLGFNAGASSAGAGAGAAAGFGPLHQGSDGAGSIRMPAHFSGVFGLKPTFGRVPNVPVKNNDQTSHTGPMTRTVADSAAMVGVMAGPHPHDHYSLEAAPADYLGQLDGGIKGLRIAFSADLGHARVDANVAEVVARAARVFADVGADIDAAVTPFGPRGPELVRFFWAAHELGLAHYLPEFGHQMDPGLVACIKSAEAGTASDYIRMRAEKLKYVAEIHGFFDEWDLLVTPAVSVAAFPADRLTPEHWPEHSWDWLSWAEFSYPFNLSSNPAAVVPAGFTDEGLPVGLQIVGRRFDDLTVLKAARAFEQALPWASHRPPLGA